MVCIIYSFLNGSKPNKRQQQRHGHAAPVSCVNDGLWRAAPIALFFLDLVHPLVCRTLFDFFTPVKLYSLITLYVVA